MGQEISKKMGTEYGRQQEVKRVNETVGKENPNFITLGLCNEITKRLHNLIDKLQPVLIEAPPLDQDIPQDRSDLINNLGNILAALVVLDNRIDI